MADCPATGLDCLTCDAICKLTIKTNPSWTAPVRDMLSQWDSFMEGGPVNDEAAIKRMALAAVFAAQAFEDAVASPITADSAPGALLSTLLIALLDPESPDLDHLRACNRSDDAVSAAERNAVSGDRRP